MESNTRNFLVTSSVKMYDYKPNLRKYMITEFQDMSDRQIDRQIGIDIGIYTQDKFSSINKNFKKY